MLSTMAPVLLTTSPSLMSLSLPLLARDGTLSINGVAKSIHNTSKDLGADGDVNNGSSPLDNISLLDELVVTEDHNTNIVGLQVKSHPLQSGAELHHLLGLDVLEAIDTGDTVTNGQDTAGLLEVDGGSSSQDSLLQDGGNLSSSGLGGINLGGCGQLAGSDRDGGNLLCQLCSLWSLASQSCCHPC